MPPTLKNVRGHIALGLSVSLYKKKNKLGFLNFIDGFRIKKLLTHIFFSLNYLSLLSYAPFKVILKFCNQDISKQLEPSNLVS